jgi:hypothetical protein
MAVGGRIIELLLLGFELSECLLVLLLWPISLYAKRFTRMFLSGVCMLIGFLNTEYGFRLLVFPTASYFTSEKGLILSWFCISFDLTSTSCSSAYEEPPAD